MNLAFDDIRFTVFKRFFSFSHHMQLHSSVAGLRQIWDFDGQGLANVAWAFAVLGFRCTSGRNVRGAEGGALVPQGAGEGWAF